MFLLNARRMALVVIALMSVGTSVWVIAASTEERIAPVDVLCMAGDPCAALVARNASSSEPRDGETVYSAACFSCHATGAAGAPKLGDADWDVRLAARGLDALYVNAIQGYNTMPAKGRCMDCSDKEIEAAVGSGKNFNAVK